MSNRVITVMTTQISFVSRRVFLSIKYSENLSIYSMSGVILVHGIVIVLCQPTPVSNVVGIFPVLMCNQKYCNTVCILNIWCHGNCVLLFDQPTCQVMTVFSSETGCIFIIIVCSCISVHQESFQSEAACMMMPVTIFANLDNQQMVYARFVNAKK